MGFDFKKIKGLFVQTSEDPKQNAEEEKTKTQDKEKKPADKDLIEMLKSKAEGSEVTAPNASAVPGEGVVDQKILDSLIHAIESNNMPGEDYLEYMEALAAMQNIPLEESVKIQTVIATLSTRGLTKGKIINSGDYYVKVLGEEKAKFYKALDKQVNENVTSQLKNISAHEELIKETSNQIAALTKEIAESQKEIEKLKGTIKDSETKFKTTENNFVRTFDFVVNQMKDNIDKIKALDTPPQ